MKLDRLVGILSILLQKEQVTAPQLAEKFEASVRTILRDLDALSRAGIPIVTRQGSGGGISILEGYKLDRTLLTSREMQDILTGLRSLDSVNGTNRYQCLMEKLSADSSQLMAGGTSVPHRPVRVGQEGPDGEDRADTWGYRRRAGAEIPLLRPERGE